MESYMNEEEFQAKLDDLIEQLTANKHRIHTIAVGIVYNDGADELHVAGDMNTIHTMLVVAAQHLEKELAAHPALDSANMSLAH